MTIQPLWSLIGAKSRKYYYPSQVLLWFSLFDYNSQNMRCSKLLPARLYHLWCCPTDLVFKALNYEFGIPYKYVFQIAGVYQNCIQISLQIIEKMSKLWSTEHRLTNLVHLYIRGQEEITRCERGIKQEVCGWHTTFRLTLHQDKLELIVWPQLSQC